MLVEVVLCARLYKRPPEEGEDEDEGEEGQKEEEGEGACEENKRIERPNGFNSDPHRFCHCTAHQGGAYPCCICMQDATGRVRALEWSKPEPQPLMLCWPMHGHEASTRRLTPGSRPA